MNKYIPSIEPNSKLEIKFDTSKPLDLHEFTNAMNAIGELFYIKARETENSVSPCIYLAEVRKGSYIFDLVIASVTSIDVLIQGGICNATYDFIKTIITNLINGIIPKDDTELKHYKKAVDIIKPIAKDDNSTLGISYINNAGTINMIITSDEAKKANINHMRMASATNSSVIYEQQPLVWVQANFTKNKQGNKAIIEAIDSTPLKVILSDPLKKEIFSQHADFPNVSWQELVYIVDVEVLFVDNKPKFYKIIKNYPEYTECRETE